jgi:hypothetical protein
MLIRTSLLAALFSLPAFTASRESAEGAIKVKSLSKLTFAPDGTLFAADSIAARIYAIELGEKPAPGPVKPLEIPDIENKIAAMLGADAKDVLIHDMSVNPVSRNVYFTVSRGKRNEWKPFRLPNDVANATVLLRATPGGEFAAMRLDSVRHSWIDIANPIADGKPAASWKKAPESERADVVSDMQYIDGKLYVAGLSNEEFASTMRIYPYPFKEPGEAMQLEVFHGAHGKWETESPVRSFLPYKIGGKPHLIAAYLCTPFAIFPVDLLKDKAKVKGTTLAELGSGSFPVDMVAFRSLGKNHVIVVNSTRGLMKITAEELERPHTPITKLAEAWSGAKFEQVRHQGVLALENFGEKHLLALQRNSYTGTMNLTTWPLERE